MLTKKKILLLMLLFFEVALAQAAEEKTISWFDKLWSDPIATFTGVLAVATIGLIVVSAIQWVQMKRAVDSSEDTAKRELRAYLGIIAGEVIPTDESNFVVWIDIANMGKTPAHGVTAWVAAKIMGVSTHELDFKKGDDEGKGWVMVPGASWRRHVPIDVTEMAEVEQGKKRIWVWGGIQYTDSFGESCNVEFRYWNGHSRVRRKESGAFERWWPLIPDQRGHKARYGKKTPS